MKLSKIVAAATLFAAAALFVVACSSQARSPVSPDSSSLAAANLEGGIEGSCTDGKDNDGDKLIDCADPDCSTDPACVKNPPPTGTPCSPGYWKNHTTQFNDVCQAAADSNLSDAFNTCQDLLTAITCTGNQAGCTGARRQAAAALLNAVPPGCTE
jgi:hypothetical protein